jgi:hypothetical protein
MNKYCLQADHSYNYFNSLWDGEKFNLGAKDSDGCFLYSLKFYSSKQVKYIFLHHSDLVLYYVDQLFEQNNFNINKHILMIPNLKEYLESHFNVLIARCRHNYDFRWMINILKVIKLDIQDIPLIQNLEMLEALIDNNSFYTNRIRIVRLQYELIQCDRAAYGIDYGEKWRRDFYDKEAIKPKSFKVYGQ